jgi:predicted nucleic acid-binding protein
MPSGRRPVYYWESSIWIVYFNEGRQHPDVFERIEEILKLVRRNQVTLVTSVITRAELLEDKLGPASLRAYDDLFSRRNIVDQPVTRSITMLASDYRSHFATLRKAGKFADAIHLATAVDNKADEFHTTDAGDLLPCNGDSMLRGTQVIRPSTAAPHLFTGVGALPVPAQPTVTEPPAQLPTQQVSAPPDAPASVVKTDEAASGGKSESQTIAAEPHNEGAEKAKGEG